MFKRTTIGLLFLLLSVPAESFESADFFKEWMDNANEVLRLDSTEQLKNLLMGSGTEPEDTKATTTANLGEKNVKEPSTEELKYADPFDKKPVELENFYTLDLPIVYENITALNLTISIPKKGNNTTIKEPDFYSKSADNLHSIAPNLKTVRLDGGYVEYIQREKLLEWSFEEEMMFVKSNLKDIAQSMYNANMTIESISYAVWLYADVDRPNKTNYVSELSKVFESKRINSPDFGRNLHEMSFWSDFKIENVNGEMTKVSLKILVRIEDLRAEQLVRLERVHPVDERLPLHCFPLMARLSTHVTGLVSEIQESVRSLKYHFAPWLRRFTTSFMRDVRTELKKVDGMIKAHKMEDMIDHSAGEQSSKNDKVDEFEDLLKSQESSSNAEDKNAIKIRFDFAEGQNPLAKIFDGFQNDKSRNPFEMLNSFMSDHTILKSKEEKNDGEPMKMAGKNMLSITNRMTDMFSKFLNSKEMDEDRVIAA